MTNEHSQHLSDIIRQAEFLIANKYKVGVEEHGGKLWEKKGLIDMALDEAIDQVVYLLTLKQQIQESGVELGTEEDAA